MNICFLLGSLAEGGIGRVSSIIMNALSASADVNIWCCLYSKSKKNDMYPVHEKVKKVYLLEEHASMKQAILRKHIVRRMRVILRKEQIDLLIACGDMYFPLAILATIGIQTKVICWDHTAPNVNSDQQFQRISRLLGTRLSDKNVVLTKAALEAYNQRLNPEKNIQIYNPVDPLVCRSRADYQENSTRIISVGRLVYQKNFSRLLDIAKIVICNHPEWHWDIYGDGQEMELLKGKCKALGLEQNVHFMGQAENIYELYANYAFMVMTSRYEGFPMTLLEAAANGLPLVSFDIATGPNEIIRDRENGFLCNPHDDCEMIDRIQTLIADSALRCMMSKRSFEASKAFGVHAIVKQWLEMFDTILGEGN